MDTYIYTPHSNFSLKVRLFEPLQITAENCCSIVISMGLAAFPRKIPNSRVSFVLALSSAPIELADFDRVRFFSQEIPCGSDFLASEFLHHRAAIAYPLCFSPCCFRSFSFLEYTIPHFLCNVNSFPHKILHKFCAKFL